MKSVFAAGNSVTQRQPYHHRKQKIQRRTPVQLQSQQQLSTNLLNKVMQQNARLKKILREIVSRQYGGLSEYLVGVSNLLSIDQSNQVTKSCVDRPRDD